LGSKIRILLLGVSIPLLGVAGFFLEHSMARTIGEQTNQQLKTTADLCRAIVVANVAERSAKLHDDLQVALHTLDPLLDVGPSGTVTGKDQENGEVSSADEPLLRIRGVPAMSTDHADVDLVNKITGDACTIFQAIPAGIVRVSTSVRKADGNRAVGTMIPVRSPVYQALADGKDFEGRALVAGRWFLTAYHPRRDASGKLTGAIFVGRPETDMEKVAQAFDWAKIGRTGYPSIFDPKGVAILHPTLQGKDLSDRPYIQQMLHADSGQIRYLFEDPTTGRKIPKRLCFNTVPKIGWKICVSVEDADVFAALGRLRWGFLGTGVLMVLALILISFILVMAVAKPMARGASLMTEIADGDGDLTRRMPEDRDDEIGELSHAFNRFVTKTREVVASVATRSDALEGAAAELVGAGDRTRETASEGLESARSSTATADAAREEMERTTSALDESCAVLERIAASVEQMNASVREIAHSAETMRAMGTENLESARTAAGLVDQLSSKNEGIEKALRIVTDIADQTKLLALNASIEAARAGEAGKGFAVVASEVKSLAKNVGEASSGISIQVQDMVGAMKTAVDRIRDIQVSVETATRAEADIAAAVEQQSATVREVAENLGRAVERIRGVGQSAKRTRDSSGRIASEMRTLQERSNRLLSVAGEVRVMAAQLSGISGEVRTELARFRIH
jgi:methyl-accepting chemotaxis protein